MISLYILLIAVVVAIFGLFVTIFSWVKKVDRSKRMGHFFLVFGIIVALVAGFSMNKEHAARQAAIDHQKQIRADQMYDAKLVHLSAKKVRIDDGQAKIKIHVSKNTAIKITSSHKQLRDLDYKPNKVAKDILVTFVMPGKYTVTATRGENKVVKHMTILKDHDKHVAVSSSEESSSEEVVESSVAEPVIPDTEEVSEESSSEEEIVPSEEEVPDNTTPDTGVEQAPVPAAPSYQPVWTPSYEETPNTGGNVGGNTDGSDNTAGASDGTVDSGPASSTDTESAEAQDTAQ
ncbi:hypothetical protein ACFQGR_03570 [Weissella sagaensis]|jgi:hypothetical protein|uniref:Uncharacterized protein n=1 Tax=Weissella sagaensis TaxID=2559928 RepID=A0ABW1RSP5_9LACO|nr:hypothetical protein [Weissella sagaensis]KAA8432915.1 hypothetical protein FKV79_06885 [Weissella paramesenteroides]KAA8436400.1 hypothetical protein FKV73_08225 [Weissella paramesenteroides]QEA57576.1 hypothetical protein FGL75_06725 [Weissella hellenica]UEG66741.1 hypothetical protein GZH44_08280 [Weissella hellenica]